MDPENQYEVVFVYSKYLDKEALANSVNPDQTRRFKLQDVISVYIDCHTFSSFKTGS